MSLGVLCLAAIGMVAFATSATTGLAFAALRAWVERLAPSARSRLYLWAALLPFLASAVVITASLAPSFGWVDDHCDVLSANHIHPHICAHHRAHDALAWPLVALALALSLRFAWTLACHARGLVLATAARRALDATSRGSSTLSGVRVLPVDAPQAFALGLLRPRLYVTRGLESGCHREHLPAVLAHERAHVARRDPLRRFVAGIGLAFHLPLVARWLRCRLEAEQEMAADERAAMAIGSRRAVARAVVALSRSKLRRTHPLLAFSGSEAEARVRQLLAPGTRHDRPTASALWLGAAAPAVVIALSADAVHHAVEHLLGAFGS